MVETQKGTSEVTTRRVGQALRELDLAAERPTTAAFENTDRRGTMIVGGIVGGVVAIVVIAIAIGRSGPESVRVRAGIGEPVASAMVGVEEAARAAAEAVVVEEPVVKPKAVARRKEPSAPTTATATATAPTTTSASASKGGESVGSKAVLPAMPREPAAAPAPEPPAEPSPLANLPGVQDEPVDEPAPAPARETE